MVIDSGWERKTAFFKDVVFGKAIILQWKSTHAKIFGKHKLGFIGFVFAVIVLNFFFKKMIKKVGWVKRDYECGKSQGREGTCSKYFVQTSKKSF